MVDVVKQNLAVTNITSPNAQKIVTKGTFQKPVTVRKNWIYILATLAINTQNKANGTFVVEGLSLLTRKLKKQI